MSKLLQTREQEWQFAAEGLDSVREWIARQPGGYSVRRFAPRPTLELHDTYFDSADWKIFTAGFALRLRQAREESGAERSELTLKALRPANDGFANRTEISELVPNSSLAAVMAGDSALAARIRELVGARAGAAVLRAHAP
jgi:inorganic triphosphatase YgiF